MNWLWFGIGTLFGLAVSLAAALLWIRFMRSIDQTELAEIEAARAAVRRHREDHP